MPTKEPTKQPKPHRGAALRTEAGSVARAACIAHPTVSTRMLSRILHRDHPLLFASPDQARKMVAYYRGSGRGRRASACVRKAGTAVDRYELPAAEEVPFKIVDLPSGIKRWLIIADLHCCFYDPAAVTTVLDWGTANRCDGLVILGDLVDFYQISRFSRRPNASTIEAEVDTAGDILDAFLEHMNPKQIVWKGGNHEYRLEPYLATRAPDIFGLAMKFMSFHQFMALDERRTIYVPSTQILRHHGLHLLHGHEFGGGFNIPISPARTAYTKTHACAIVAHLHTTSEFTQQSLDGETITCWSIGALCNLHPQYRPINPWNQGFGCLYTEGDWHFENHRILKGGVV